MAVRSNTYAIRAGANQFASAADGMRQISNRVQQIAATLSENWQGQAENSFHKVAELLQSDIQTASDAFERAFSALDTLANQLDQANALYQQADQIGSQIQSLEWSLSGADEQNRASLSSEIAQLSYRRSSLENEAPSIEYQANSAATAVFNDIASLVNRLHSYSGLEKSPSNNSSIADKIGHFIGNLWNSVDNEFKKIENSLEQDIQEFNDFASEHPAIGTQIGFTEGLLSAGWDAIKASWDLEKILIGADPQGGVDLVKSVFHAVVHPEETYHNLVDDSKVIWSTISQSFEDEVVHGNAFTASKWTGYAVGEVAQLLIPDGEGEVAAVRLGKEAIQVGKKRVQGVKKVVRRKRSIESELKQNVSSESSDIINHMDESTSQVDVKILTLDELVDMVKKSGKSDLIDQVINELGSNIKNNPLRQAYENEVASLINEVPEYRKQGLTNEQIAKLLSQQRRDLGIKYKNATPPILRDYIYAVNMDRYGDKLGPSIEFLKNKYDIKNDEEFQKIIDSSTRPNPNVDELLGRFKKWLIKKTGV